VSGVFSKLGGANPSPLRLGFARPHPLPQGEWEALVVPRQQAAFTDGRAPRSHAVVVAMRLCAAGFELAVLVLAKALGQSADIMAPPRSSL